MNVELGRRGLSVSLFAVLLLCFALPGEAQDVTAREQQLRQRVEEVYKLFVTGEWRKVEQYVSEDSRDLWFGQSKSTIDSFQTKEITIDPDGKRADVTVMATFQVPQTAGKFTMPQKAEWVLENGMWFLKVKRQPSLFEMFRDSGAPSSSQSPLVFEQNPVLIPKPEDGSSTVVRVPFQNITSKVATIQEVTTTCSCLTVVVDRLQLQAQEQALLTVTYHPPPGQALPPQLIIRVLLLTPAVYQFELPVLLQGR